MYISPSSGDAKIPTDTARVCPEIVGGESRQIVKNSSVLKHSIRFACTLQRHRRLACVSARVVLAMSPCTVVDNSEGTYTRDRKHGNGSKWTARHKFKWKVDNTSAAGRPSKGAQPIGFSY